MPYNIISHSGSLLFHSPLTQKRMFDHSSVFLMGIHFFFFFYRLYLYRFIAYILDLRAEELTSISPPLIGWKHASSESQGSGLDCPVRLLLVLVPFPGLMAPLCWASCSSYTAISCGTHSKVKFRADTVNIYTDRHNYSGIECYSQVSDVQIFHRRIDL